MMNIIPDVCKSPEGVLPLKSNRRWRQRDIIAERDLVGDRSNIDLGLTVTPHSRITWLSGGVHDLGEDSGACNSSRTV